MQSETDILVDPLEALRVLHSHEEFLSQVFKRFVSRQIQAVETGKKNVWLTVVVFFVFFKLTWFQNA